MKISLNWIKEYLDFELPPVDELVNRIGEQLGAVEEVINLGERYKDIVIVRIVTCERLENSDHLNRCMVDDGGVVTGVERDEKGLVQVVTGAPNVHGDMYVVWLPPGSTVPASFDKEPFVMEARQLRGALSNGMLASAKELAIGDSHEGIMEITDEVKPGADFAETFKLNDYIIDIENKMFTHRPDCFGMIGVAREIAGILGKPFTSPDWFYKQPELASDIHSLSLTVTNEIPELVPRFLAVAIEGIKIHESPIWLQSYLSRVGIRPINNIVDMTNYIMVATGQPMHAYDYDKVKALGGGDAASITVRNPRSGEKITLLSGKEVEPRAEAIMIATGDKLIGIGGVMGGADSEVDGDTKNIILECATFDMYSIRRTSMEHGLFTDAVTRFNKGQSPLQNAAFIMEAAHLTFDLSAGAQFASDLVDDNHLPEETRRRNALFPPVTVTTEFINARLGLALSAEAISSLLTNVECKVNQSSDGLTVEAPFWRTDIELREDVVEEVGRLYGFDRLPLTLPKRDLTPVNKDPRLELKARLRHELARAGGNEVLTYSFVHGDLLEKAGQDKAKAFQLSNALSPELQYYRMSLTPSLLSNVHSNIKAGYSQFALFEIGTVHLQDMFEADQAVPAEALRLSWVYASGEKDKGAGAAYYQAQQAITRLLSGLGLKAPEFVPFDREPSLSVDQQAARPFEPSRSSLVKLGDNIIAIVGEFKSSVTRGLKLPNRCSGFELDLDLLSECMREPACLKARYQALPRFPKVTQDITLKVAAELSYGQLLHTMHEAIEKAKPAESRTELYPIDIFQRSEDMVHKQVTWRLEIASFEKTLTDSEVNSLLDKAAGAAREKYQAERI